MLMGEAAPMMNAATLSSSIREEESAAHTNMNAL
jgi:hypothetical protein